MWSTIIEGEGPEQSLSHRFAVNGEPGKRGGGLEERGVEEEKRGGGATRLFGLHWETTASQDGQKVRG